MAIRYCFVVASYVMSPHRRVRTCTGATVSHSSVQSAAIRAAVEKRSVLGAHVGFVPFAGSGDLAGTPVVAFVGQDATRDTSPAMQGGITARLTRSNPRAVVGRGGVMPTEGTAFHPTIFRGAGPEHDRFRVAQP